MPEVDFARETRRFVETFRHMGVSNPWLHRMLVGRLYYAAHHVARRVLVAVGLQPDQWRANVHQQVLKELDSHCVATSRMTSSAWTALEQLRRLRVSADYDLTRAVRLRHVNAAVAWFDEFCDESYRILEVS